MQIFKCQFQFFILTRSNCFLTSMLACIQFHDFHNLAKDFLWESVSNPFLIGNFIYLSWTCALPDTLACFNFFMFKGGGVTVCFLRKCNKVKALKVTKKFTEIRASWISSFLDLHILMSAKNFDTFFKLTLFIKCTAELRF